MNIMNIKVYLYVIFTFLSVFAVSGLDFSKFINPNKTIQAKVLAMLFSFALGYLITNFIISFLNL